VQDDVPLVRTGGDVEKSDFVRALLIVAARDFDRISGVAQFDEVHAFDDAARVDVQTGNDALCQHREISLPPRR
jgi:hypothetical protein